MSGDAVKEVAAFSIQHAMLEQHYIQLYMYNMQSNRGIFHTSQLHNLYSILHFYCYFGVCDGLFVYASLSFCF